ncbi:MAG TPA: hypothetical protein VG960_02385 [Caulobacteraceae bacterium]|nr:hypothetical protein [Caulobacteraceae bacterium]
MIAAFPLLALIVLTYNLVALTMGGMHTTSAQDQLTQPLFSVHMASSAVWSVGLGDVLVLGALILLFVELLKSTASRHVAIINHSLSMILFIVCLVEFLLFGACATSTFFLITLMVLLDVLAGFIVTIVGSRHGADASN